MDDCGILKDFTGTVVHDHWKPYFRYEACSYGLCNVHHLRELRFIEDHYNQEWAKEMSLLLLEIKEEVERRRYGENSLSLEQIERFEKRYDEGIDSNYVI